MPLRVGLTGGIGSGKSTVCAIFDELGVPVLDADLVAREVVAPGSSALEQIAERFGRHLITPDGTLDRATLRREIFAEPVKRGELETLLHPLIQSRLIEAAHNVKAPYCVISVPLLVESGWTGLMDRVLVVDVSPAIQRERAMIRDGLTVADAEAIMRTQATREQRLAYADDVIRNDGDIQHLRTQVQHLHRAYGELAARHSTGTDPR